MPNPAPRSCEVQDCEYKTPTGLTSHEQQFQDIRLHLVMAHPQVAATLAAINNQAGQPGTPGPQSSVKAEKLSRPYLGEEITEVDWGFFLSEWSRYKRSTGLTGQNAMDQLWACASDSLKKSCHQSGAKDATSEEQLLEIMKKLSIKATNNLVNVVQFLTLAQNIDEPVTQFVSRLKGQSSVCDFEVKCSSVGCDTTVSYSDKMVSHQLVRGLADASIQEKVLALAATEKDLSLKKITEFVLAQETGTRSSKLLGEVAGISRISDYKKGRSDTPPSKSTQERGEEKCQYCGKSGHGGRSDAKTRKELCPAWGAQCDFCGKIGHFKSVCWKKGSSKKITWRETDEEDEDSDTARTFLVFSKLSKKRRRRRGRKTLPHVVKNKFGQWVGAEPNPHPVVIVGVSVSGDGYEQLEIPEPAEHEPTNVQAIADTGATVMVGGIDLIHQLRVEKHELIPVSHTVGGINHGRLELLGGLLVNISLGDRDHQELCYIAKGVKEVLLSGATMKALGIISENFPAGHSSQTEVTRCERRDRSYKKLAGLQYPQQMAGLCETPVAQIYPQLHHNLLHVQQQPLQAQQFNTSPMFPVWSSLSSSGQSGSQDALPVISHYNMSRSCPAPPWWGGGR